ncbi:transmembrane amino acid transporter protein-domain-containing protein [Dichotomocladium elegans]|nr:transmembrane amino acid transporter protein-domain-containing protein [Dichotomocladium elegans]
MSIIKPEQSSRADDTDEAKKALLDTLHDDSDDSYDEERSPPLRTAAATSETFTTATTEYYAAFDIDDSEALLGQSNRLQHDGDVDIDDDRETEYRLPNEGGSVFASFLNMSNSIIGAGIIGLPFSFREAGFGAGLILLVILTILVDWTVRLLIYNGKLSGRNNYQDLLEHAFGRPGLLAISIAQFVFAFGAMCAYCVIIGDTIPHVFRSLIPTIDTLPVVWIFANRRLCITFFTVLVSYPLSLYRDMSKLAKTSGLALITIIVIIVSVAIEGPRMPPEIRGDPSLQFTFINSEMIQAIAVISFAFVCHHNSFMIFGSLRQPSMNRFAKVTHYSMALSFVTCTVLAVSGYVVFTDKTAGNILNNFPADVTLINVARLAFGMNMFTTLPLEAFVCREVLEVAFWNNAPYNLRRHAIMTTALVLVALIISLLTCNLGIVLELTGGFSATMLAYILPPLCYLKLAKDSLWQLNKLPYWALLCFGLVIMVVSTFFSLQKVVLGKMDAGPTCDL